LNPRRTHRPETVFETAAFDRSATPPTVTTGYRSVLGFLTRRWACGGRRDSVVHTARRLERGQRCEAAAEPTPVREARRRRRDSNPRRRLLPP